MTCGKCFFLDVKPDSAGRIVPRKDGAYKCLYKSPDLRTMLPESEIRALRLILDNDGRLPRSHMSRDDGENCRGFTRRS
jgi:hypothetical protein